ncbi:unnamed protein product [Caenorhabditis angaria]|uniref:Uncharacterized protein n=1 Tax=Caenorhabditis angaria TaxID=860376 RepID=A0A9P1J7S4_9PELO|nr:unnamed protein product [Caenorhabditis angaria]
MKLRQQQIYQWKMGMDQLNKMEPRFLKGYSTHNTLLASWNVFCFGRVFPGKKTPSKGKSKMIQMNGANYGHRQSFPGKWRRQEDSGRKREE